MNGMRAFEKTCVQQLLDNNFAPFKQMNSTRIKWCTSKKGKRVGLEVNRCVCHGHGDNRWGSAGWYHVVPLFKGSTSNKQSVSQIFDLSTDTLRLACIRKGTTANKQSVRASIQA